MAEETQLQPSPEEQQRQSTHAASSDYEDKMLEAFVQKPEKFLWYKTAFERFNVNGIDRMAWKWSWWAFFGGFWFLIYRKTYMAAFVLFLVAVITSFIPLISLVIGIWVGGFATYFVYKTYKTKKTQIEATIEDEQKRIETMYAIGGYNAWVVWMLGILLGISVLGIVSALVLPSLAGNP